MLTNLKHVADLRRRIADAITEAGFRPARFLIIAPSVGYKFSFKRLLKQDGTTATGVNYGLERIIVNGGYVRIDNKGDERSLFIAVDKDKYKMKIVQSEAIKKAR